MRVCLPSVFVGRGGALAGLGVDQHGFTALDTDMDLCMSLVWYEYDKCVLGPAPEWHRSYLGCLFKVKTALGALTWGGMW